MAEAKKTVADLLLASAMDEETISMFRAQRNSRQQTLPILPDIELAADEKSPPHRQGQPRHKADEQLFGRNSKSIHRELDFWSIVEEFSQVTGESPEQQECVRPAAPAEFELI